MLQPKQVYIYADEGKDDSVPKKYTQQLFTLKQALLYLRIHSAFSTGWGIAIPSSLTHTPGCVG